MALPVASSATATAETPASNVLYVAKTSTGSDAAADSGSEGRPFCTISAAAAVVEPGQTVLVEAGDYQESVTITRSGTADAPMLGRGAGQPDGGDAERSHGILPVIE